MVLPARTPRQSSNLRHISTREDESLIRRLPRLQTARKLHRNLRRLLSHHRGKHGGKDRNSQRPARPAEQDRGSCEHDVPRCCRRGPLKRPQTSLLNRSEIPGNKETARTSRGGNREGSETHREPHSSRANRAKQN